MDLVTVVLDLQHCISICNTLQQACTNIDCLGFRIGSWDWTITIVKYIRIPGYLISEEDLNMKIKVTFGKSPS